MSKKHKRRAAKAPTLAPAPPAGPVWMERLPWQILGLAVLALLAYWNSLHGAFLYDDTLPLADRDVVGPGFGWGILHITQARPLTFLTFHWNYLAGGNDPAGWHCVNLLLHVANTVLVLLLARRHLSRGAAFLAAGLFGLHPLATEAVSYIYQRSAVLATFFALLSFLLFLKERYAWSVGAFALSLLSKEETIALPALLLLYDLVYRRVRPRVGYYAATASVAGLAAWRSFYVWRVGTAIPTVGYHLKELTVLPFSLTEARVVWMYLGLWLCPVGQNVDHDVVVSRGLLSPGSTLPALLGLAALVGMLIWLAWRRNQPAFWGLGFFVLLAPTSSIVPVEDVMFEHRVYFPMLGLSIAAAAVLAQMPRRWLKPIAAAILVALLGATVARNRVWHDGKSLWTDAVRKSPRKARVYAALGRVFVAEDPARAGQLLKQALTLFPKGPAVWHNDLGVALLFQRDAADARRQFEQAISQGGETADYVTNLGMAFRVLGQLDRAIENFRRALELDPCAGAAREDLARALLHRGDRTEALQALQVPAGCHLTPEDIQKLDSVRQAAR